MVIAVILTTNVDGGSPTSTAPTALGQRCTTTSGTRRMAVRGGIAGSVDMVQDENPYTIEAAGRGTAPP